MRNVVKSGHVGSASAGAAPSQWNGARGRRKPMGITICLAACALALGQTPDRGAWSINPQLAPGLELVYSGTFTEKSVIPNVQTERTYRLENHIFVTGG